jgi:hypothetical protein
MIDMTNGKLDEALKFAETMKDESLKECINGLKRVEELHPEVETTVCCDFAPHSFYFERYENEKFRGNGGIIYHGKHDGFGSGSAPTFSVCLEPTQGWQIHT